jgi:hypothetical protein
MPMSKPSRLDTMRRSAALARVAEKRYITNSAFWGQPHADRMSTAVKRDLPAFWSVSVHGQPFNDERLTDGSSNHYKVASPPTLGVPAPKPVGPATESLATLKSSLQNGFALFGSDSQMTPLSMEPSAIQMLHKYEHTPVGCGETHALQPVQRLMRTGALLQYEVHASPCRHQKSHEWVAVSAAPRCSLRVLQVTRTVPP